jgi:rubrerythrin
MAISIEYAAYDLYRNMADFFKDDTLRDAFLSIAQAEKEHMRIAAEALGCCRS